MHLYQPANTDAYTIKEATQTSYLRLIRALEENPKIKFTWNISGCLLMRWEDTGFTDAAGRIKRLVRRGRLELTGTAMYHAFLPLVPIPEAERQILENERILRKYFGTDFKPRGFYLPEMAYNPEVARLVAKLGYEWLILDEIAVNGSVENTEFDKVYKDDNSGLKVVVRSRLLSNTYVPETIRDIIRGRYDYEQDVAITATDAELYGLRHIDHTAIFEKLLKYKDLRTATVSEFIDSKKRFEHLRIPTHSWAASVEEFKKGEVFSFWKEEGNKVHAKLWELAYLAYDLVEAKYLKDKHHQFSRWHLVRGLASCTFWWASARDFKLFGPLCWSPDEVERGVNELIRSIRAIDAEESRGEKIEAEKLYIEIKKMIWLNHWNYYWKKTK